MQTSLNKILLAVYDKIFSPLVCCFDIGFRFVSLDVIGLALMLHELFLFKVIHPAVDIKDFGCSNFQSVNFELCLITIMFSFTACRAFSFCWSRI